MGVINEENERIVQKLDISFQLSNFRIVVRLVSLLSQPCMKKIVYVISLTKLPLVITKSTGECPDLQIHRKWPGFQ